ncbi:amiloride-sensitive cation channel 2, neuronal [Plakobranchus ocellatus]|uniref:Amiloride-sensitive cation channel 2, neuronal n=1 Tax=Plakobranchus ocellatus TaxID=259542 RepID=A0AAV4DND2_9GAST|nr:amiloride-sensitive cation channel 2, neuronal [Plakobranchus ocellatus]
MRMAIRDPLYPKENNLPFPYRTHGGGYCDDNVNFGAMSDHCIHACIIESITIICNCSAFPSIQANSLSAPITDGISVACRLKCPSKPCRRVYYTTRSSYANFPSKAASKFLKNIGVLNSSKRRYLELRIFFEQMLLTNITYDPLYTKDVLLVSSHSLKWESLCSFALRGSSIICEIATRKEKDRTRSILQQVKSFDYLTHGRGTVAIPCAEMPALAKAYKDEDAETAVMPDFRVCVCMFYSSGQAAA